MRPAGHECSGRIMLPQQLNSKSALLKATKRLGLHAPQVATLVRHVGQQVPAAEGRVVDRPVGRYEQAPAVIKVGN
jgi:hypothetical protein